MTQYIVKDKNHTAYYKNKAMTIYHREDGPALKYADGAEFWYQDNVLHRVGEPAAIYADGVQVWLCNGEKHNPDGYAYINPNSGEKQYWIFGKLLTEKEFLKRTQPAYEEPLPAANEETITIEGKKMTLRELKDIIEYYYWSRDYKTGIQLDKNGLAIFKKI
jgi:hypothetical protein